jgi:hypothetical protein
LLGDVCPNCGGNFVARPIRPRRNWRGDNHLGRYPASLQRRHRPVDLASHAAFAEQMRVVAPHER